MPSGFTREQIEAIAALAHLELDDEEIARLSRQLGDVLAYANHVQSIDTTGIAPTASVGLGAGATGDRADEVTPSLGRDEALANAPDPARDAGLFKVPQVIG
jgi:aspartyl-tRNA(Asn)/glutamyl-tRNA(Gln) amidotransferase subunit C